MNTLKKIALLMIVISSSSYQLKSQIPTNNLVGYYPFDGNANDQSGNLNNGTVNGPVLTNDRFGNANSAYFFDGIDDWINLGDNASLHYTSSGSHSISIWFKSNITSNSQQILVCYDDMDDGDGDSNNPRNMMQLKFKNPDADGDLDVIFQYGTSDPLSLANYFYYASNDVLVGVWNHLCTVKDAAKDTSFLYLNGQLVYKQQDVAVGTWQTTGQYMMLGKYQLNNGWLPFSGMMDDIRFYNMALDPCEVLDLYHENDTSYNQIILTGGGSTLTSTTTGVSYQWIECTSGNPYIVGQTGQNYAPPINGSYAVEISENGCKDTSNCYNFFITDINHNKETSGITIFPNPTSENVSLTVGDDEKIISVKINNISGQECLVLENLNNQQLEISLNNFSKGIYFLNVETSTSTEVFKLVKE